MRWRSWFSLLKETYDGWQEDGAVNLGAALAYYTIFSLAPLLLVVIGIAGLVFGRDAVQGQIFGQIRGMLGDQGAQEVQTMIAGTSKMGHGWIATVVGFATILTGAIGVFVQLQSSLDQIWEVKPKPGQGIRGFLRVRILSFGLVMAIGFLLLVSLVVSAGLAAVASWTGQLGPAAHLGMEVVNNLFSLAVITVLFAVMYRFLPDAEVGWRDVWVGAGATALLFTVGKALLGLYIGHSSFASSFGAAGSLVIILVWIYYSTQILFFGAEFTKVYALHWGSRITPDPRAVKMSKPQPLEGGGRTEGSENSENSEGSENTEGSQGRT